MFALLPAPAHPIYCPVTPLKTTGLGTGVRVAQRLSDHNQKNEASRDDFDIRREHPALLSLLPVHLVHNFFAPSKGSLRCQCPNSIAFAKICTGLQRETPGSRTTCLIPPRSHIHYSPAAQGLRTVSVGHLKADSATLHHTPDAKPHSSTRPASARRAVGALQHPSLMP